MPIKKIKQDVELHPDLAAYVEELDMFPVIRHPLVFSVPYFGDPFTITRCNSQYALKRVELIHAKKKCNWSKYVFLHERPYRLEAFMELKNDIKDDVAFWDLFMDIWSDSENIFALKQIWFHLIRLKEKPSFDLVINEDDRKVFNELPEELTIYRGTTEDEDEDTDSLSWTIDKKQAEWFANRFNKDKPKVIERKIKKSEVLSFYNGRSENEIIIYPKK